MVQCRLCGDTRDNYNWSRIIGICHDCRSYYKCWKELKDPRMLNSGIEFRKYLETVTLKHRPKNEMRIDWDHISGWTDNKMYMIHYDIKKKAMHN